MPKFSDDQKVIGFVAIVAIWSGVGLPLTAGNPTRLRSSGCCKVFRLTGPTSATRSDSCVRVRIRKATDTLS
jgi:hypothetical protein